MPVWLTSVIELVVGLACLGAAWWTGRTLSSRSVAAILAIAGLAAAGHAVWVLAACINFEFAMHGAS